MEKENQDKFEEKFFNSLKEIIESPEEAEKKISTLRDTQLGKIEYDYVMQRANPRAGPNELSDYIDVKFITVIKKISSYVKAIKSKVDSLYLVRSTDTEILDEEIQSVKPLLIEKNKKSDNISKNNDEENKKDINVFATYNPSRATPNKKNFDVFATYGPEAASSISENNKVLFLNQKREANFPAIKKLGDGNSFQQLKTFQQLKNVPNYAQRFQTMPFPQRVDNVPNFARRLQTMRSPQ
ncbi:hypothetical protein [Holospora elegans]|uniref:hypothetical protein n=1 Tax=Holospora elegans TaxID=431043 RepID=UPI00139224EA|nr:hypothetical protein [Holospora elegans]